MNFTDIEKRFQRLVGLGTEFQGVCFRSVRQQFANQKDILSIQGSIIAGGRFNFNGAFGALYLACDAHTCIEESIQANRLAAFKVAENLPRTLVGIRVRLKNVLDLAHPMVRKMMRVSKSDLIMTEWEPLQRKNQEAITQVIGRLAREAGFEAILFPSARMIRGLNLSIFTDNLTVDACILVNENHLPRRAIVRKKTQ